MPSTGGFPLPCSSKSLLTTHTITSTSSSHAFPCKTQLIRFALSIPNPASDASLFTAFRPIGLSFPSLPQFRHAHLAFSSPLAQRRGGSRPSKRGGPPPPSLEEMEAFDDEFGGEYDEEEFDDLEDDDGSVVFPFDKMNKWLENKPRGFGEGKVYDTSTEDQLLEEMRLSGLAQAANLEKLKNAPVKPVSKQDEQKKKANELVPNGVRVRVVNLPKKKNVHRDLSTAFKEVPGLLSINPAVLGNKKTRDPICKGFAFVDFKSEEHATRFIQMFSRQAITFGKIQKQIKYEMMNPRTSESDLEQASTDENTYDSPQLEVHGLREDQCEDSETNDHSLDEEWEHSASDEYDVPDDELNISEWEDISENLDSITITELSHNNDDIEQTTESEFIGESLSSNIERIQALENELLSKGKEGKVPERKLPLRAKGGKVPKKNPAAKRKEVKVPKLDIPGSSKRLKVKERAVFTDVFSKYGLKSAVASKEES
ncbi:hypothetical protein TIFTF001_010902 [Ficus carica]|uniref:RRM domain-containing protein n=1 Tax=Ficus carica TaxID=3494 RepID=A0AA88D3S4_FICCA|nr:hypothetical protein TIFTF001_010902 [Ficus carica]